MADAAQPRTGHRVARPELGDFLRSRRQRLDPASYGRQDGRRRRTPGLRREEVAERASIGVDWYIRLEQGRDVNPSAATLESIARALDLSDTDYRHLQRLARPSPREPFTREHVPTALAAMVEALGQPAYVLGRRLDVLAWNHAACELVTDFSRLDESERNILLIMMTNPDARALFGSSWADEARRVVAAFRSQYDLNDGEPAFVDLVEELNRRSPTFATWWGRHEVRPPTTGTKTFHREGSVPQVWTHQSFLYSDDPRLRLVVYSALAPPGRDSAHIGS